MEKKYYIYVCSFNSNESIKLLQNQPQDGFTNESEAYRFLSKLMQNKKGYYFSKRNHKFLILKSIENKVSKVEIPKFVKLNNTALRLIGDKYYRDGGEWEIGYKVINGVLLSWAWGINTPWLHKKPLVKITEDEWRNDNGVYAENIITI